MDSATNPSSTEATPSRAGDEPDGRSNDRTKRRGVLGSLVLGFGACAAVAGAWYGFAALDGSGVGANAKESPNAKSRAKEIPEIVLRGMSDGLPNLGHWRGKPALGDLDRDGNVDLVASIRRIDHDTPGKGLHVWLGDGAGRWRPANDGLRTDMGYGGAELGDLNGDDYDDIVFSAHDVPPQVFLAGEPGHWVKGAPLDVKAMCSDVAVGDLDRDGRLDVVALGFWPQDGGMWIQFGNGDGSFRPAEELMPSRRYGAQVTIVELAGEPHVLAATDRGILAWRHDPAGTFSEIPIDSQEPEVGGADLAVTTADFDGDGAPEIVASGMTYPGHPPLRVLRRDGDAWASWGVGLPDDEPFFDVVVARGAAGRVFLLAAGKRGVSVIEHLGGGRFARSGIVAETRGIIHLAVGDVDGDGRDDLACVGNRGVSVFDLDAAVSGGNP